MNQAQLRELESRIDEVLYYIWDPIGVSDVPAQETNKAFFLLGFYVNFYQ